MNRDTTTGPDGNSESVAGAAARAWSRVPASTRRKFNPKGEYRKRLWESLLYHVARDTDARLRPVLRHDCRGELTADQAGQLVAAVVGRSERLDRAGDWVLGMAAARGRIKRERAAAGLPLPTAMALLSHRVLPAAWARSGEERAVDPDECEALFQSFVHDDPHAPPPTHAAFRELFARPREREAMREILAAFAPPAADGGDAAAARDTEALLLDAPLGADWERLWARYALLRPWQRHTAAVHTTGLSRHAVPGRPSVGGGGAVGVGGSVEGAGTDPGTDEERDRAGEVFAHSEGSVLPLDRSLWLRLDHSVRTLVSSPTVARLTAREVAHDEARRALAPLGLSQDAQRAVLCLGLISFAALGAEHAAVLLARPAAAPRLLVDLAELTERKAFVAATLRLGSAQHAPVRRALADPVPGCTRLLWRMLHSAEIRQEDLPDPQERWARLVRTAAHRYLQVLRGELKLVLSGAKPVQGPPGPHLAGDALERPAGSTPRTEPAAAGPAPGPDPLTEQLVVDVLLDGLAQRGTTGAELVDWIDRLIDPLHGGWAVTAWDELYAEYRGKHQGGGRPGALPPVAFETARDIVRSHYRPEAGGPR
ncbi:hypothetical protein [Streptomyces sp. NPDC088785]|uniref:hypothetical protein n=1 Tax=Streptomyces sp. NPDC088785 TaxID=3365897 RepID=UPI0038253600